LPSKKKRQNVQDEKTVATARIEEMTAEFVAVEKKRQDIQDEKTAATARIEGLMAELVAVKNRRQDIQNEKMAATARVEELTAELVAVEKKATRQSKSCSRIAAPTPRRRTGVRRIARG
jgi:chromosome segregation ATPase